MNRAFITHTTKNYESIAINLVNSIHEFSEFPIIVYTLNYTASKKLSDLTRCVRIDMDFGDLVDADFVKDGEHLYVKRTEKRNSNIYMTLSSKIDCILSAVNELDEWVYLDGDCIANSNIDDLFGYCKTAINYPIATLGPHEYLIIVKEDVVYGDVYMNSTGFNQKLCIEYPLYQYLGYDLEKRTKNYKTTNIIVGNNTEANINFIKEWKKLRDKLLIELENDLQLYLPFHEETIYNLMVWEIGEVETMPLVYLNVIDSESVQRFFDDLPNNNTYEGNYWFTNKTDIKVFHGEKRKSEFDKIIKIINNQKPLNKRIVDHSREVLIPDMLNSMNLKIGIEIGVFKGNFSKTILEKWEGTLYLVDPWRPLGDEYIDASNHKNHQTAYIETMDNIGGYEDRAFMLRGLSEEIVNIFPENSLDFVYIDGNHKYDAVKQDMELWWEKLKPGGLFAGHDYLGLDWTTEGSLPNGKDKHIWMSGPESEESIYAGVFGVNPAVDEFCKKNNYELQVTQEWLGTWFIIKREE